MNESFLSFVWKYRLYSPDLLTHSGESVKVISPGEQHSNAGPDFFNARIRIGETEWAGNVEIHTRASDWYRHSHHTDDAYSNVILHVVYELDTDIITGNMTVVPAIELKKFIDDGLLSRFNKLRNSAGHIPCGRSLAEAGKLIRINLTDRMLTERLEHKSLIIELALAASKNDLEEMFYLVLARNFGFNVNSGPFEMLARCIPRKLVIKYTGDRIQAEALLFGQAGLLQDQFDDDYPRLLQKEYRFISSKYQLIPMQKHLWKFLRMRPSNFPTIRMSQFAHLVTKNEFTLQRILETEELEQVKKMLNVSASHYWETHYVFDKISRFGNRDLGRSSVENILINTVIPVLFYFGRWRGEDQVVEKAFGWLKELASETNTIINLWRQFGVIPANAYESQALLGLYQNFCSRKKCLNCNLGITILRKNEPVNR